MFREHMTPQTQSGPENMAASCMMRAPTAVIYRAPLVGFMPGWSTDLELWLIMSPDNKLNLLRAPLRHIQPAVMVTLSFMFQS